MRGGPLIRALAMAGALLAMVAPTAGAQSSATQQAVLKVFQDYAIDGRIDACRHTSAELELALDNIPPDIEQYASEYPTAIEDALEARARGDCAGVKPATGLIPRPSGTAGATPSATPTPTPTTTPVPTKTVVAEPPSPDAGGAAPSATPASGSDRALERVATARASNDAPLVVLLLGALAALLLLLGLLLLAMRRLGIADERLAPAAHTWREARWRAGGTWDDFRDWLRTGR